MKRLVFYHNGVIQVFRLGPTSNDKIAGKGKIVQTYSFSPEQFEFARTRKKGQKDFFNLDKANCGDCVFSSNNGCYTHKYNQYSGFLSMLRSIAKEFVHIEQIPSYSLPMLLEVMNMCEGKYVRFGTYGEPSLHPIDLIDGVTQVAKNWTGYTHQWMRHDLLGKYFMASVHSTKQAELASDKGYRSFIASKRELDPTGLVHCPASKEMGYKSNCETCGLCSGTTGKGNKSVIINEH